MSRSDRGASPGAGRPARSPESFLPLAPRELLILVGLTGGDLHGYGLIQEAERLSEGRVRMDPANLYRTLKRLVRDELVIDQGRAPSDDAGGERRRYYAITALGESVVAAEAERLARLAAVARERQLIAGTDRPR